MFLCKKICHWKSYVQSLRVFIINSCVQNKTILLLSIPSMKFTSHICIVWNTKRIPLSNRRADKIWVFEKILAVNNIAILLLYRLIFFRICQTTQCFIMRTSACNLKKKKTAQSRCCFVFNFKLFTVRRRRFSTFYRYPTCFEEDDRFRSSEYMCRYRSRRNVIFFLSYNT